MATFSVDHIIQILSKTPSLLQTLLSELPDQYIKANEGPDTWSAFDVVGHLVHLEKTDWVVRMDIILSNNTDKTFAPVDRTAQLSANKEKTLTELLAEFDHVRRENIMTLQSKNLTFEDLQQTGIHPTFGKVTLQQLLATWTVHDLDHLNQIARVIAKQHTHDVGPWIEFLRILK